MPETALLDDKWIIERRGPRNRVDPSRPYAFFVEPERTPGGPIENVATIFITNKECPFRCLFCDLWKNTTTQRTLPGNVAAQVEWALAQLPPVLHLKLYNSGNFFDEQAIARSDRGRIARLVAEHRTVIVECHPKLVDRRCLEFAESLKPTFQVAMGLETVDPSVLPRLNKQMTTHDYARAAGFLVKHGIGVRAFILLRAPFQSEEEGVHWAKRSIEFAFSIGVECCSIIPTRAGNGAMESLQEQRHFHPPAMKSMEDVLDFGLGLRRGRVFMDLWDIGRFVKCSKCGPARTARLAEINFSQSTTTRISCDCGT